MEKLRAYWIQITAVVGILTGGGAWVATADTSHQQTEQNRTATEQAIKAVNELRASNQLQSIAIRIICSDPAKAQEATCLAIKAQDQARAAAKKAAEAAK